MKMMDARITAGTEYFYGFSVYLPSTWELSEEEDILFQWKGFGGGPFMFLVQGPDSIGSILARVLARKLARDVRLRRINV